MIAGGGEQMTLRAVARLADACNIVDGDIAEVRHKLAVLRGHCDAAGRDYDTIEKTRIQPWALARDAAAVAAKRERLATRGPLPGFVGTVFEAIDLIGQYQNAGVDLLIDADRGNDVETRELFVSDVMPHFAWPKVWEKTLPAARDDEARGQHRRADLDAGGGGGRRGKPRHQRSSVHVSPTRAWPKLRCRSRRTSRKPASS
jgi:hypothetical protein